jgi:hypothetical protein
MLNGCPTHQCVAGLLIFGRTHVYMLEGLVENGEGEVIEASSMPEGMFLISGSTVDFRNPQRAQRWLVLLCSNYAALNLSVT